MQIYKSLLCCMLMVVLFCACDKKNEARVTSEAGSASQPQFAEIQSRLDRNEGVTQQELDLLKQQKIDNQVRFENGTIADISLNGQGVLLLTTSGGLFAWGSNEFGMVGNGTSGAILLPNKLQLEDSIVQIDTADTSCAAVSQSGKVYMWGNNEFGIFGTGNYHSSDKPVLTSFEQRVKSITISNRLSTIITENGQVYGCGSNFTAPDIMEPLTEEDQQKMTSSNFSKIEIAEPIKQTATSLQFRAFLAENGMVFVQGKIGDYSNIEGSQNVVRAAPFSEKILKIECNSELLVALGESGKLYGCGTDSWGLISEAGKNYMDPTAIDNLTSVSDFSVGSSGILATTKSNQLLAWGYNGFAQIPGNSIEMVSQPTEIIIPSGKVVRIISGFTTSALITEDGSTYLWGGNFYGQKLDGTRISGSDLSKITT